MASMTRATTSERRMARNARFTDKASVVLPDEAMAALLLIPAVSISRNFWGPQTAKKKRKKQLLISENHQSARKQTKNDITQIVYRQSKHNILNIDLEKPANRENTPYYV